MSHHEKGSEESAVDLGPGPPSSRELSEVSDFLYQMLNVCKYCVFKVINLPAPQTLPSYVGPIPGTLPIVHGEGRPPPGLHQISPSLSASVHPPPPYYQAAGDMTVTERLSSPGYYVNSTQGSFFPNQDALPFINFPSWWMCPQSSAWDAKTQGQHSCKEQELLQPPGPNFLHDSPETLFVSDINSYRQLWFNQPLLILNH